MKQEVAQESLKSAPPLAVTLATTMGGLTINEIVALATLAYIGLQAAYLLWKWWKEYRASKR